MKQLKIVILLLVWMTASHADVTLQYQNRGDRYEGIKPKPVSGYDIELISVLVDYQEKVEGMPDQLKVRLFLNEISPVNLVIREVDYKHYYWLDKARPLQPWQLGFSNLFEWPTRDVLQKLGRIKVYELGVVARLGKAQPSRIERVAPVILYHHRPPGLVEAYLFTFKTSGAARLTCTIYPETQSKPLFDRTFRRVRGGRPFTFRWDTTGVQSGAYRLVVDGYLLDTSAPLAQTVSFYHQPLVR